MNRKPNPTAYHLIDEEVHHPGFAEENNWDIDHRGAGSYYGITMDKKPLTSINTKFPTYRRRDITEENAGIITLEYSYVVEEGSGFYAGLFGDKNDVKEAFVLRQKGDKLYVGDTPIFDSDNLWHYVKLVADIDKRSVQVHLDGKYVGEYGFTGGAVSICRFECGYQKEDLGKAVLHATIKLYKNYLFNDWVISHFDGDMPEEYTVTYDGEAQAKRREYFKGSRYAVYDLCAKAGSKTSIVRRFDKNSGVVGFEMKYLLGSDGGKITVSMLSGDKKAVSIHDELLAIYCGEKMLWKHSFNIWQTLRIEADTKSGKAVIRHNGKFAGEVDLCESIDALDGVCIEYETSKDNNLLFTELKAFPIPPLPDDYVSEPVIPKKVGDYYVGMNICSLWRSGNHFGWECITPFKDHKPLLGYYDEGIPETADWELKWMAEHGLDFELYCWYGMESALPIVRTRLFNQVYDGHMMAKYSDKVKLALLWEAFGDCPKSFEHFKERFAPHFIDYFFTDPRYMTIDGMAVMSVYGPQRLIQNLGGNEGCKEVLDYLRDEVKKLGYKGMIITVCGAADGIDYKAAGFDAIHAYNLGKKGYDLEYTKKFNLDCQRDYNVHTVPTVSSGYNFAPWRYERSPIMEKDDMVKALEWVKDEYLTQFSEGSWQSKFVMLSTWNEYGEGTFMCPSEGKGFDYLDALREVFTENTPHVDVKPTQDQLDRIDILFPQDRACIAPLLNNPVDTNSYGIIRRYEFKTQEDLDKWEFCGPMKCEIKDGILHGISSGRDPYMILKDESLFPLSSEKVGKIVANIRTEKGGHLGCTIHEFLMDKPGEWNKTVLRHLTDPDKIVPLTITPFQTMDYPLHMTIYGFRFDPVWGEGEFELESIEFHYAKPHRLLRLNGEICDLCRYPCRYPYEENGAFYIPFDTRSNLKELANLCFKWENTTGQFTIFGEKTAVFEEGLDYATVDREKVSLSRPLVFTDGIPDIDANLLAELLDMELEISDEYVDLNSKK